MRAVCFDIAPEMLASALGLPAGAHIDAAIAPVDRPGVLRLRVFGIGGEIVPGAIIPLVTPRFHVERDSAGKETRFTDWGC